MAQLTEQEANRVREEVFPALDGAKQINDLPVADSLEGAQIEVQTPAGESKRVNLISAVSALNKRVAIRRWNETLASPVGEAYGNIDFLRELPSLLGLGCYLVSNDRKMRKLDSTDHRMFADGSAALLDGSDPEYKSYMLCWAKHHFGFRKEGNYGYEAVSLDPLGPEWESYCIPAGGISAVGGGVLDRQATGGASSPRLCSLISDLPRYRGGDCASGSAHDHSSWDNMYNSLLGMVATNIALTTFSTYARERGEGWEANWYVARAVIEYLFRIIMGTRNSQSAFKPEKDANGLYQGGLGMGVTEFGEWSAHNDFNPIVKTSDGLSLGDGVGVFVKPILNSSGQVAYNAPVPVFFGGKNLLYGNVWQGVRGLLVDVGAEKTRTYVAKSLYAGQSNSSVDLNLMVLASEQPRVMDYIKRVSMSKLCCMPTEVGGTSSTYYGDLFWTDVQTSPNFQGLRSRLAGAGAYYGTQAGAFATRAYYAVAYAHQYVSAPLCFFTEDPVMS